MENMAAVIGETSIVHGRGREVRRIVHFSGEISVAGGGRRGRGERVEGVFAIFRFCLVFLSIFREERFGLGNRGECGFYTGEYLLTWNSCPTWCLRGIDH